jgi:hypothetical protein
MDIRFTHIKKNKKAILFSLISVLFSMLFITIFSQTFSTAQEDRIPGSNIRIKVIDVYTRNFETYVGDSIKLATYKTLDAITIYQDGKGFFADFTAFNKTFYNCMLCGYVDCSAKIPANNCNLGNDDLTSRINNITQLSLEQINIKTNYTINSITIAPQTYPFEVEVTVNITYEITDASGGESYAKWTKEKIISQSVSIEGLLDPTGKINDANYERRITIYSGICESNSSCWNPTTTRDFYQERSFRYYTNSTSFLQRYWNDYSDSGCCGIETIIHPSELAIPNLRNSYIDQYYWRGGYTCDDGKSVINITFGTDEVHLDSATAARYGVTGNGTTYCTP